MNFDNFDLVHFCWVLVRWIKKNFFEEKIYQQVKNGYLKELAMH